jgi:uncharacterized protein (DUF1778 family)
MSKSALQQKEIDRLRQLFRIQCQKSIQEAALLLKKTWNDFKLSNSIDCEEETILKNMRAVLAEPNDWIENLLERKLDKKMSMTQFKKDINRWNEETHMIICSMIYFLDGFRQIYVYHPYIV